MNATPEEVRAQAEYEVSRLIRYREEGYDLSISEKIAEAYPDDSEIMMAVLGLLKEWQVEDWPHLDHAPEFRESD